MELLRDKIKRDTFMVSKLCGMIARGDLRDDHPQQRKSGQWTHETRDNFIVTVIKNEDFDPIKICEQLTDKGVVLWLIDGLQRSTTIENYKAGRFKLGRNINPYLIEYQEAETDEDGKVLRNEDGDIIYRIASYDLRGKSYAELPDKLKEEFNNCPVYAIKHLDCTDEEVGRHIVRYNSGRAMVAAQKISAYMYNTAKYVKALSGHAFFNDCANYSETADRNGTVDKVVSETIMGLNFFDSWNKNAQKIGQYLNNNATEEMFNKFKRYLNRLLEVITPNTGKLFTPKNALLWFMLFDRFVKTGLSDDKFQLFLENFEELKNTKVEVEHEYEIDKSTKEKSNILSFLQLDTIKSTKDKGVVSDKLHILETLMNDFLHINEETVEDLNDDLNSDTDINTLDFVKENIKVDATEEDIEFYEDVLNDLIINVDNSSKLLDEHNKPSLIALVAYSFENDVDLDDWITDYFERNNKFIPSQKENYKVMVDDLRSYLQQKDGEMICV